MSAEDELPLPGEPAFKYKDNLETLGALWDNLKGDADKFAAATTPIRGSAAAIQAGNQGLTAEASTSVVNHVSRTVTDAATRIRWFERPIKDYLAVLDAVRGPINTLRDKWREGERDLRRVQNGEVTYTGDGQTYAQRWASRQTEIRTAYDKIITDTVDPAKSTFVAALWSISRDAAPAPSQPITLPALPGLPALPVRPIERRPRRDPVVVGPGPGPTDPGPGPTDPPPPPAGPTAPEILGPWFEQHPDDGPAILAAWLLLPAGATTYERWAASAAGRTALATWIAKPRQDEVFEAWLATPAAEANLTAWIRDHGGLPEGELPADPRAWITDPANAGHRRRWLADPATRELMATWIGEPGNLAHRTAWLADAKTQTSAAGWVRDPEAPTNGTEFAAWTKAPTPIEPLRPTPEPDPGTADPPGQGSGSDDPPTTDPDPDSETDSDAAGTDTTDRAPVATPA